MAAPNEIQVLKTHNLSIGYQGRKDLTLLQNLSLGLSRGSLTGIIGINGAGKSTLLRTLAGVQPALEGSIHIAGKPLEQLKPTQRAERISVVFTDPPASGNLSVYELVALGRYPHTNWLGQLSHTDEQIIQDSIVKMDLRALAEQPCYTLSDGQLQRALIARALAQDTPLMLLDEPTSHLDLYHKVNIFKGLKDIAHNSGKALVLTTHEIDLAIQLCDFILVLHKGKPQFGTPCKLIQQGAFEELFPKDTLQFNADFGRFEVNK